MRASCAVLSVNYSKVVLDPCAPHTSLLGCDGVLFCKAKRAYRILLFFVFFPGFSGFSPGFHISFFFFFFFFVLRFINR